MRRPAFVEGVAVAAVASVAGAASFAALTAVFAVGPVSRLLVAGIGLAYVMYLLSRSSERIGRITVLSVWLAASLVIWWYAPSFPVYLLLHVAMIWLIRSLYFHAGVLGSGADLGLSALALAAGVTGGLHTGSVFVGIWCFFLTQALFVFIPAALGARNAADARRVPRPDRFEQAHRAAESALRKFSSS